MPACSTAILPLELKRGSNLNKVHSSMRKQCVQVLVVTHYTVVFGILQCLSNGFSQIRTCYVYYRQSISAREDI